MNQTETVRAVQKMQEYIEGHLHERITLKQLSDVGGYSPWHAARIFKEETGKTPFDEHGKTAGKCSAVFFSEK